MFDLMTEAQTIYQQLRKNPQKIRTQSAAPMPDSTRFSANPQNPQREMPGKVDALPEQVTCSSCTHFERDRLGSGQGIGHCNAGQDASQITCLWPDALRQCPAWSED